MKTKTGVAVWVFDSRMATLQALEASPWQTVGNFVIRAASRTDDARIFPEEGHCSKPGVGLLGSGDYALMWEEDPKFPASLSSRAAQGPALVGQGAGQRNEKGKRRCLMWYRFNVVQELSWRWSGERDDHARTGMIWGSFDFWKVQSTGTTFKALGWGCTNDAYLLAYTARCMLSLFLKVSYMILHWSCQKAVY